MILEDAYLLLKRYIGINRRALSDIELTVFSLPGSKANNELIKAVKQANTSIERAFIKWQSESKPNGKNKNAERIKINT